MSQAPCPVCAGEDTRDFCAVENKQYFRCNICHATFLHPRFFLTNEHELAHYQHHDNQVNDPAYRKFLQPIATAIFNKFSHPAHGLDYGCGPGPALAAMLRENGYSVDLYDPYFYPKKLPLENQYDFITCTETAEHFHYPNQEFARFDQLLKPGGWLAIMTCFQTDDAKFAQWHYRRDPTHVVFYHQQTFEWIAKASGYQCEILQKDVAFLQKPNH